MKLKKKMKYKKLTPSSNFFLIILFPLYILDLLGWIARDKIFAKIPRNILIFFTICLSIGIFRLLYYAIF